MGTHYIDNECILCGTCVPVCPVTAISEGEQKFIIDKQRCNDCGACDDICPVDAIKWLKTNSLRDR